eukprot:3510779-Rhodomonas_salina.1
MVGPRELATAFSRAAFGASRSCCRRRFQDACVSRKIALRAWGAESSLVPDDVSGDVMHHPHAGAGRVRLDLSGSAASKPIVRLNQWCRHALDPHVLHACLMESVDPNDTKINVRQQPRAMFLCLPGESFPWWGAGRGSHSRDESLRGVSAARDCRLLRPRAQGSAFQRNHRCRPGSKPCCRPPQTCTALATQCVCA